MDLCSGSGTTLAAALEENCRFLGVDVSTAACALTRKRLLGEDFSLVLPCAEAPAKLDGEMTPAGIVLTAYAPSAHPEAWEMHGLTAVEQWSAGRIRGGVFYPVFSFARSAASPALPETSFLPEGEGVPAVEILDLWGEKHMYTADSET